jgi:hypothetical protein
MAEFQLGADPAGMQAQQAHQGMEGIAGILKSGEVKNHEGVGFLDHRLEPDLDMIEIFFIQPSDKMKDRLRIFLFNDTGHLGKSLPHPSCLPPVATALLKG